MGEVGILSVGAGDIKLTFDKTRPQERIRAARIVKDMLKRGYALLIEIAPGEFQRATRFDEERCEYIIADFDGDIARSVDQNEQEPAEEGPTEAPAAETSPPRKPGRPRKIVDRVVPAENTRAIAVARSAGG